MRSLNDIGDPSAPVGSRAWVMACNVETQSKLRDAQSNVGDLRRSLRQFEQKGYYRILENRKDRKFESFDEFCAEPPPWGLGLAPDIANAICNEPVSTKLFSTLVSEVIAKATPAMTRAEAGAVGGRGKKALSHVTKLSGANRPENIASRLKRDHPDIAAAAQRGEFKSMRAAGIAAGFVKPRETLTIGDPDKLAARIFEKTGNVYAARVRDTLTRLIEEARPA